MPPANESILDVRPAHDFERLHHVAAVNIPLEELADRIHELGPPETPIQVFDIDDSRARRAGAILTQRGRIIASTLGGALLGGGSTAKGPSPLRLWRPHPLLLDGLVHMVQAPPPSRVALDLACGSGRDAVWLAMAGWEVHAWDLLPDALDRCADLAARNAVKLTTRIVDLEDRVCIPADSYDLVCCFNYLHRPLLPELAGAVRPGGYVIYETFAKPQRELFGKPSADSHLLDRGELSRAFAGWKVVVDREGLSGPRRFASGVIAQRPIR